MLDHDLPSFAKDHAEDVNPLEPPSLENDELATIITNSRLNQNSLLHDELVGDVIPEIMEMFQELREIRLQGAEVELRHQELLEQIRLLEETAAVTIDAGDDVERKITTDNVNQDHDNDQ